MQGEYGRQITVAMAVAAAAVVAQPPTPAGAECRALAPLLQRQPTSDQWERIEERGVVFWLSEVAGSRVKEGVAVGLVEAPPERVFSVVTDNGRFAEFMPYVEESTVERLPEGRVINRQRLDLPWPVHDREYKILLVNEAVAEAEPPLWRSSWTHVKGFGNIEESCGAWRVYGCDGISLVEYQVFTDPGGSIPTYFKNKATSRSLRRLIEAVRQRVGDPSYDVVE